MQQQLILPEGGLASFLTSNLDEIDDSRLMFGNQAGINSHRVIAERMAGLGRNGDTELIHAEKGEIVIHPKLLEENPRLAKEMMDAFNNSDVDLNRYIIGSKENSINPDTGQAEFFFKKIARGLKKAISGVKKIVKKFAPIIIAAGVNFFAPGLGTIAAGALSGGITSLAQGGNFKDSMKSALMGGFVGGISAGVKGAMSSGEGGMFEKFTSGVKEFGMPTGGNIFKTGTSLFEPEAAGSPVDPNPDTSIGSLVTDADAQMIKDAAKKTGAEKFSITDSLGKAKDFGMDLLKKKPLSLDQAKEQLIKGGKYIGATPDQLTAAAQALVDASSPGLSMYKTGAALLGGAAFTGAFDPIKSEPLNDPYDGVSASETRLAKNPFKYSTGRRIAPQSITMDQTMVPAKQPMTYEKFLAQQAQLPQLAAGGEMGDFPRRTGYIGGPGTETSDSIPAMLSDGEFVMNAKAVRGAGNGSRKKGVRKMYDMMRAFEGGSVA